MVFEAPKIEEISRDIYALSRDGDLSESEKIDYEEQVQQIKAQTQLELQELRRFMAIFENVEILTPEEKIQLQIILAIDPSQRDGIFGPATFQKFINFQNETSFLGLPKDLIARYSQYKTQFEGASPDEQKKYQRAGEQDGKYGPNTFRYMLSQDISQPITPTHQQESIQEILPEISGIAEKSEQTEIGDISQISGDQYPDEESEVVSESEEEKNQRLIQEAKDIPDILIRQLQTHLGGLAVDGAFGPQSVKKLLDVYPSISSISEAFETAGIDMSIDDVLVGPQATEEEAQERFRELYGALISELGVNLGLPDGLIDSIVAVETTYGKDLGSPTGSKGLMQLTVSPFEDMMQNKHRVAVFQPIYQDLSLQNILSIEVDGKPASERMPASIVDAFRILQNPHTSVELFQEQIRVLQTHLKGRGSGHDHEANLIVGAVYLTYQYRRHDGDVYRAARDYNGEPNGGNLRYARNVTRRLEVYEQEHEML